jgi:hypothetical protein
MAFAGLGLLHGGSAREDGHSPGTASGSASSFFEWISLETVLYLDRLKQPMPIFKHGQPDREGRAVGILLAWLNLNKGKPSYDQIVGSYQ